MDWTAVRWRRVGFRATALVGAVLMAYLLLFSLSPRSFVASEWQAVHSNYTGMGFAPPDDIRRARMVDSLLKSHVRVGMSPADGRSLLGKPETEGGGGKSRTEWYQEDGYALTHSPLARLPAVLLKWHTDNPYLYVRYENGKLVSAEVK